MCTFLFMYIHTLQRYILVFAQNALVYIHRLIFEYTWKFCNLSINLREKFPQGDSYIWPAEIKLNEVDCDIECFLERERRRRLVGLTRRTIYDTNDIFGNAPATHRFKACVCTASRSKISKLLFGRCRLMAHVCCAFYSRALLSNYQVSCNAVS